MRPNGKKLIYTIGLMVTLSIFIGCGSDGDILDPLETSYNAYALPYDGPDRDDSVNEIDVVRADCVGSFDGSLWPFDVEVTISSASDNDVDTVENSDFRVERYTYTLRPVAGTYGVVNNETIIGASQMPDLTDTALNPRTRYVSSDVISPGDTVTLNLPIWSAGDKDAYVTYLNTFPLLVSAGFGGWQTVFSYDIQIVLHCRTIEGDSFNITANWTEVAMGNYGYEEECPS